jgi:hypothetical protein
MTFSAFQALKTAHGDVFIQGVCTENAIGDQSVHVGCIGSFQGIWTDSIHADQLNP